ncbi:hypothetical protein ACFFJN_13875 [Erwinia mallotivora]|uniref:hypothetical protein n=1 Tax=Erwinia mallotivora TaxID=69222 RepID=UPI0035E7C6D9
MADTKIPTCAQKIKYNDFNSSFTTLIIYRLFWVDFVYNGYTKSERPMLAGSNNDIEELILQIKSSPVLLSDEPGRM